MARITFVELPVDDVAEASAFYREAFAMEMTAFGPSYACTMTGRTDLGLQGDAEEQAAAPLPVITVDDLDAAETAVAAAGGTITRAAFSRWRTDLRLGHRDRIRRYGFAGTPPFTGVPVLLASALLWRRRAVAPGRPGKRGQRPWAIAERLVDALPACVSYIQ